jgi:hypothetical protein
MARVEGHHLRLGVQNSEAFRAWCLEQGEQAATCDDFLAKASQTEADVRTFDLDRNEVASQAFAAWIQGELTAKRVEVGSETWCAFLIRRCFGSRLVAAWAPTKLEED